ncbi:hypothetical protein CSAL01_10932 [Colletotrichum salicis]|uniref:DUF7587 domain-containing protein n=1 Tax=Colletotrichum salicis TaxID=1209931 RepID=A0A135U8F3_9PEZI|nr:hypothetical protein CSAL01_10932 [Colletotrichum salicis]
MPNAALPGPSQPPQSPDNTPPYLFRVFDANSKGQTSETQVSSELSSMLTLPGRSRGWRGFLEKDDYQGIRATRLAQHLNWEVVPPYGSGLVSWTSSLLFAFQLCIYKYATHLASSQSQASRSAMLNGLYILMIDTRELPQVTFLRDLVGITSITGDRFEPMDSGGDGGSILCID